MKQMAQSAKQWIFFFSKKERANLSVALELGLERVLLRAYYSLQVQLLPESQQLALQVLALPEDPTH